MKKIITIYAAILMTASVFAQAPNKMSYQAVIRNTSNALVTNSAVGIRISILQSSPSGTAVYLETQTPTTNANGLASIEIGGGSVVSGIFSTIDWANGPYFIKTETDPLGGTAYTITGTNQLLSVPYALHSKTSESIANFDTTRTLIIPGYVFTSYFNGLTTKWAAAVNLPNDAHIIGLEAHVYDQDLSANMTVFLEVMPWGAFTGSPLMSLPYSSTIGHEYLIYTGSIPVVINNDLNSYFLFTSFDPTSLKINGVKILYTVSKAD